MTGLLQGGILYVISFTMKRLYGLLLLPGMLLAWFSIIPFQTSAAQDDLISPTPTYGALTEPPLPPNPSEYELGRNLYWHWCMTCHGDKGQGLTDEFRAIWVPEHQNCWGRGCHSGRPGEMGFPIPTVVPALVDGNHLARFSSLDSLTEFLKATHPPQSPGILKDEEYHAIALFVFTMNSRSSIDISITQIPAFVATPTSTPMLAQMQSQVPPHESSNDLFPIYAILIFAALLTVIFALAERTRIRE